MGSVAQVFRLASSTDNSRDGAPVKLAAEAVDEADGGMLHLRIAQRPSDEAALGQFGLRGDARQHRHRASRLGDFAHHLQRRGHQHRFDHRTGAALCIDQRRADTEPFGRQAKIEMLQILQR